MKKWAIVICISFLFALLPAQDLLLKNGVVYTFDRGVLAGHDLLIQQGKIVSIGKNIPDPGGVTVLDLKGQSVVPGLIDSHNHIGLTGGINEGRENITPEVRMEYQINPDDPRIYYCLTGGVTMTHTMHGSANPIGGQNVTIKLKWGKSATEMWEKRAWRTLKMALGENPKRQNYPTNFPSSRMGTSYSIKRAFDRAKAYRKEWQAYNEKLKKTSRKKRNQLIIPRIDVRLEALLEALDGKLVIRCHSYRADETLDLIRLSKEVGFKVAAFEHIHQAYRIADELAENGIGISVFCDSWNYKSEASEFTPYGYELLYKKGVIISLNSDTSESMRRLYMEAGKMRRYAGMDDLEALKTVTLNAAIIMGLDKYLGSIETGKDADLAVFDGHPLSSMSKCTYTIIEGEVYFDRSKDTFAGGKKPEVKK